MATIIQLITKLELGGAQDNTLYTCKRLLESGHRVILIASEGMLLFKAKEIKALEIILIDSLVREINPIKDFITFVELIKIFRKIKPDLVHTHSSKAGILGRFAAAISGFKAIHTIHGFGINPFQNKLLRIFLILLERIASFFTLRLIAVSREDINKGVNWGMGDRDKYILIRSGIKLGYQSVPPDDIVAMLSHKKDNQFIVGTVSCLKHQKNPLTFVEIAKRIDNAFFIFVGDGELKDRFLKKVSDYKIEERVIFLGWRYDARDIISLFDCFVLTSLWEGLPRVLLEAIDSGVPIVASNIDGNKEVVFENRNGFLVEPYDVPGFVDRIKQVLKENKRFKEETRKISIDKEFISEFGIETMGDKLVELIEGLYTASLKRETL
ncbi:MAG: glycosyltransferase family 4 protein [Candidatus Hydrogenedentota bacterium]